MLTIDRMKTIAKRTGRTKYDFFPRSLTGAYLDLPPSAHRHHWVPIPWAKPNKRFTGGMCTHCGDFMLKIGNGRCCGPGFP